MIPIEKEPDSEGGLERCCFCREHTEYWTTLFSRAPGEQVACCPHCAGRAMPDDVPTKKKWCRTERIAHRPTPKEIFDGSDSRLLRVEK